MAPTREEIEGRLGDVEEQLDAMIEAIQPVVEMGSAALLAEMEPLESARMQLSLAYAMNSLFQLYMRIQGGCPEDHPIHKDMERIVSYMDKVGAIEEGAPLRDQVRVNAQAASRFIRNALWEAPAAQGEQS